MFYGARIHIATGGPTSTAAFPGQEYIYLLGGWGSIEMGNWPGADSTLNLCPVCDTYAGYGGIDTPWASYAIDPHGTLGLAGPGFRNFPSNANWFSYGTKITYYTPQIMGAQVGFSYMPTSEAPETSGPFLDGDGNFKDVFEFGAKYDTEIGPITLAVSAVGAISNGDTQASAIGVAGAGLSKGREVTGLGAWEVGAVIGYEGFVFGASY